MKIYIKIGVPRWEEARNWGDYHFALAMQRSLADLGHQAVIQILPEWDLPVDGDSDVTIHLMGLSYYRVKKGPLNIIWIISHPEKAEAMDLDKYDLVFAASRDLAAHLAGMVRPPVLELLQFADTYHMYPDYQPDKAAEILFVGNSRKVFRKIVEDIMTCSGNLRIWGSNWEMFLPARLISGAYFPYENVRQLYSSCAILLNDHWDDMRQWNMVNNRVFDALACKTLVVSDQVDEIGKLFGDSVVMYSDRRDLCDKVDYYLKHEQERKALVENGHKTVIGNHGVMNRMQELLAKMDYSRSMKKPPFFSFGRIFRHFFRSGEGAR
ncbi:MAG: glycosyltransferase family 1 protein [Deltaproteobacteria bacterium]|nr:glycosyltransferase family 1 protein [Deltaproteobacteria bacterium]